MSNSYLRAKEFYDIWLDLYHRGLREKLPVDLEHLELLYSQAADPDSCTSYLIKCFHGMGYPTPEGYWKYYRELRNVIAPERESERRYIIAVLCGFQEEIGHNNSADPEYRAYQRVIEFLLKSE